MIELKVNEKLYYIENCGCDDTTHGLAIIPDEHFPKFKEIIENLNKNSTYGCMPTIEVYRIDPEVVREVVESDNVFNDEIMHLNNKLYIGVGGSSLYRKGVRVV